jgi:type II secretory pathway component PulK
MSYETRENGELKINFGAIDEERKININSASLKLFIYLLEGLGVDNPAQLSRNILIWRGDLPDTDKIYESLGYSPKADKFNNIEELELVKGITSENFNKIKDNVTVYSDGFINANTVSEEILTLLAKSVAENQEQMSYVEQVVDNIIQQREANSYFKTVDDIVISDLNSGTSLDEELFYSLKEQLKVTSEYFKMQASGYIGRTQKNIQAVYYRTNKKIVYWHEN